MGKTVESYQPVLKQKISRWNGFARALRKEYREAFNEVMDMCRNHATAGSNACNPVLFEPMVMSIILAQQKKLGSRKSWNSSHSKAYQELPRFFHFRV